MSLYLQRHVGDTYHICPQMKVWKGHGLFAVSPPFFGAPISVSPKDSIGACRLRPEEILYGVGFNSRQIKRQLVDWFPDMPTSPWPCEEYLQLLPVFACVWTEMFCPTVETGMPSPLHCKKWLATVPAIPRIDAPAFVHQCGMSFHVSCSEPPKSSCNGLS